PRPGGRADTVLRLRRGERGIVRSPASAASADSSTTGRCPSGCEGGAIPGLRNEAFHERDARDARCSVSRALPHLAVNGDPCVAVRGEGALRNREEFAALRPALWHSGSQAKLCPRGRGAPSTAHSTPRANSRSPRLHGAAPGQAEQRPYRAPRSPSTSL